MRKLVTMMLALSFLATTVAVSFAQDTTAKKSKKSKSSTKKKSKKKSDTSQSK